MSVDDRDDEQAPDLFRKAVGDARPLKKDDRVAPQPHRPRPIPRQSLRDQDEVIQSLLSDAFHPADIETGEELLFSRPGLQRNVVRKLRRGQFAVQAELDLHGRIVAEARELVAEFIRDARGRGYRCVRIVHGKGLSSAGRLPVLKGKVNAWLQQKDEVLAFCSALPAHGGTGAVYVLLKRG